MADTDAVERVFVAAESGEVVGFCCVTTVNSFCRQKSKETLIKECGVAISSKLAKESARTTRRRAAHPPLQLGGWARPCARLYILSRTTFSSSCGLTNAFNQRLPRTEVTELFVADAHRRKGIARELMMAASQYADDAGVHEFFVLTNKLNNAGRALYESFGYVEVA